jgi:hypothetical protein
MPDDDLIIKITSTHASDDEALEEARDRLRDELQEVANLSVDLVLAEATPGTRTDISYYAGLLGIAIVSGRAALGSREVIKTIAPQFARIVHHFIDRYKENSLEIELPDGTVIHMKNNSEEEIEAIISKALESRVEK